MLRALYGLTRCEAELAVALAAGADLHRYCDEHGVSPNTARTHLKHVLDKTGLHRQAELAGRVAALGGFGQHGAEAAPAAGSDDAGA